MASRGGGNENGRGRGGGPAPRRGRGGGTPKGGQGANAPPLAAQLRQLQRLEEPEEMSVLRRYKELGADQVQSTYGLAGLLERKVRVPATVLDKYQEAHEGFSHSWLSLLSADNLLGKKAHHDERERALGRRAARLHTDSHHKSWEALSAEERRHLLMSQKEWNLFRAPQGRPPAEQGAPQHAPAQPEHEEEAASAAILHRTNTVRGKAPAKAGPSSS